MIAYLDTSAVVPLVIEEAGSRACESIWTQAEQTVGTRILYVETAAALAQAERLGRQSAAQLAQGIEVLAELWEPMSIMELDEDLMIAAAEAAITHGLRGYDATHFAAGLKLATGDDRAVLVSGDVRLLRAWESEGVSTYDINRPGIGS